MNPWNPLQKFRSDVSRILQIGKDCSVIFKWAFVFKGFMLVLQIITNVLVPDHQDSMNDVFMRVHRHPDHDVITATLLGGFDNWDAEYFIYIAQHGYTFLQSMAFFPFYPMLMWLVARVALFPFSFLLEDRSLLLLAGTLVNLCVFPLAAISLYLLTLFVTDNQRFSILTVLLFCVNPASVFMSAVYTESLFALCVFSGLCLLAQHHCWGASLLFAFASATRANGIVLAGFIAFYHLYSLYLLLNVSKLKWIRLALKSAFVCILQTMIVVLPFFLFQLYGYWRFCHVASRNEERVYEWCYWTLPLSYSFIQEHYWNVGFLRYFELKQIPNFLLALPVICLSLYTLWKYVFDGRSVLKVFKSDYQGFMVPHMLYLLVLLSFGVFTMHVQVLTRFLFSSSPVLYWFTAIVVSDSISLPSSPPPSSYSFPVLIRTLFAQIACPAEGSSSSPIAKSIVLYFLVYIFLGFLLHCNFYPWT